MPERKATKGFSDEERAAMRDYLKEKRARAKSGKVDGEQEVRDKIATMSQPDRSLAERIHALVRAAAPDLVPRTWYGMPAYSKDEEVLCWFQPAEKFKSRYAFIGFSDEAKLDDGTMWPISFALTTLGPAEEARITELVKKAHG